MASENDRKTRSVRSLIEVAFLQLLEEKPYPDITVTDIIAKAGVARVSYYRNFSSISDVMNSVTDQFAKNFLSDLVPLFDTDDNENLRLFIRNNFLYISQKSKEFRPMIEANRGLLYSSLEEKVSRMEQSSTVGDMSAKYGSRAKLAVINGVGRKWVASGMKEGLDEMVDYVMSLIRAF